MDGALTGFVGFLTLLGAVALVLRVFKSVARTMLRTAELAAASGMEEASLRRGDLTALAEARESALMGRSRRRRQLVITAFWVSWLLLPLALGWTREAWALAAPLWILQRVRKDG